MGKINMRLVDLISFFRKGDSFEEFCINQSLNVESEVIEAYMQKPFDIESELHFFEFEKTEGRIEYSVDNNTYHNLFDFYYFLDAIEELNGASNKNISDIEFAKVLLSYAINDA